MFLENSEELASNILHTLRAYSITAHCKPRQIPRNGILFTLKCSIADIFPSIPLYPKPPGMITPSNLFNSSISKLSASSQFKLSFTLLCKHAWFKDSTTDK